MSVNDNFDNPDFVQVWKEVYDDSNMKNVDVINKTISPISEGLKIEQLVTVTASRSGCVTQQKKRAGLLNLLQFRTVCCESCLELVPGWKIVDNKVVVDKDFADPKRFYGNQFDHKQTEPKEGEAYEKPSPPDDVYIKPSKLMYCDSERAENQLRITGTKCYG